jgi:cyanophycinase
MIASLMVGALLGADQEPGKLFLMGGGSTTVEVTKAFIEDCGGASARLIVMAQTREDPARGLSSVELLQDNGARNVALISVDRVANSDRATAAKELREAKGVWIPGGDQRLFVDRWSPEWLREEFGSALKRGTNFFGTSAGAMIMSNPMIAGPGEADGTVEIRPGIGLFEGLVDTHYRERNREARLKDGMKQVGHSRAIGLDAGEWVVVWRGEIVKIVGKPFVSEIPIKK